MMSTAQRTAEARTSLHAGPAHHVAAPGHDSSTHEQPAKPSSGVRRLLLILHGQRVLDERVRQAIEKLKEDGHQVTVRLTWESGDVDQFVSEALQLTDEEHNFHTIVAGGGDGTLNEVVAAMLKYNAPPELSVAQLPLGTANDLASAAGISLEPEEALRLAADPSAAHLVDVALVNGEPFMNIATAGPVSEVSSKEIGHVAKQLLGPLTMPIAGIKKVLSGGVRPIEDVRLTYPTAADVPPPRPQGSGMSKEDKKRCGCVRGDLFALAAGQGRQMGRMVNVCPEALLDDGLQDFTVMFGSLGEQVLGFFGPEEGEPLGDDDDTTHQQDQSTSKGNDTDTASKGKGSKDSKQGAKQQKGGSKGSKANALFSSGIASTRSRRNVQLLRTPWLLVESAHKLKLNRDGEPSEPSRRLLFEVLPRKILLHLPDDRLLLPPGQEPGTRLQLPEEAGGGGKGLGKAAGKGKKQRLHVRDFLDARQPPGHEAATRARVLRLLGRGVNTALMLAAGFLAGAYWRGGRC